MKAQLIFSILLHVRVSKRVITCSSLWRSKKEHDDDSANKFFSIACSEVSHILTFRELFSLASRCSIHIYFSSVSYRELMVPYTLDILNGKMPISDSGRLERCVSGDQGQPFSG